MADAGGTLLPKPSATTVSREWPPTRTVVEGAREHPASWGQVVDNRKEPGGPGGDRPYGSSVCRFGMVMARILTFRLVHATLRAESARLRRADEAEGG